MHECLSAFGCMTPLCIASFLLSIMLIVFSSNDFSDNRKVQLYQMIVRPFAVLLLGKWAIRNCSMLFCGREIVI